MADLNITFGDGCDGDAQANVLGGLVGYNVKLNERDVELIAVDNIGITFRPFVDDEISASGEAQRIEWDAVPIDLYVY